MYLAIGAEFGLTVLAIAGIVTAVAFVVGLYKWLKDDRSEQHGFEVKPTSGPSPEQREREAHHG